ncbi:MAG: hypothetical protein GY754_05585 [bacterium]|nr:hypothetical protein [bacterium]
MKKIITVPMNILAAAITLLLVIINIRLYAPGPVKPSFEGPVPGVIPQLRHIKSAIENNAAKEMQRLFPEGYYFTYVLYGLTWVETGMRTAADSPVRKKALAEARFALKALKSRQGKEVFPESLDPPYGMFYTGWRNHLLAGILLLQEPGTREPAEVEEYREQCILIATALRSGGTPYLESYSGRVWPVDSFPGMHSIRAYSYIFKEEKYKPLITWWLEKVRERLDPKTGLVPHRADYKTGYGIDIARATSQSVLLRFLADIDPVFGHEQYRRYREQFIEYKLGLPGVLEYPRGTPGRGDVDSGPLIAGVSLSATAVTLGTSRLYGDEEVARAIGHAGEAFGLPVEYGGKRVYVFGVLPVGEAFYAWSKTALPWFERTPVETGKNKFPVIIPWWWRLVINLISCILLWPVFRGVLKWIGKRR